MLIITIKYTFKIEYGLHDSNNGFLLSCTFFFVYTGKDNNVDITLIILFILILKDKLKS